LLGEIEAQQADVGLVVRNNPGRAMAGRCSHRVTGPRSPRGKLFRVEVNGGLKPTRMELRHFTGPMWRTLHERFVTAPSPSIE